MGYITKRATRHVKLAQERSVTQIALNEWATYSRLAYDYLERVGLSLHDDAHEIDS